MHKLIRIAALFMSAVFVGQASAAAPLTYVSATGNDANSCVSQAAPCKTLARGIAATSAGGQLNLLSQLPRQSASITTRSITIEGNGHTMIGTIFVNNSTVTVTFRNLNLDGRNVTADGITVLSARAIHITNCSVARFTHYGVKLESVDLPRRISVSNSAILNNGQGLDVASSMSTTLVIDHTRFENNRNEAVLARNVNMSVLHSGMSGNGRSGIHAVGGVTAILDTVASNNQVGFFVENGDMTITSSAAYDNGVGLYAYGRGGPRVWITKSAVTGNEIGVLVPPNTGTVFTLVVGAVKTNVFAGNGTDISGTLTPLAAR